MSSSVRVVSIRSRVTGVRELGMSRSARYGELVLVRLACGHAFTTNQAFTPWVGKEVDCEQCTDLAKVR